MVSRGEEGGACRGADGLFMFIRNTGTFILQTFLSTCYVCPEHNSQVLFLQRKEPSTRIIELIIRGGGRAREQVFHVAKRTYWERHGRIWGTPFSITQMSWAQESGSWAHTVRGRFSLKQLDFSAGTLVLALLSIIRHTFKIRFASLCLVCFIYKQEII